MFAFTVESSFIVWMEGRLMILGAFVMSTIDNVRFNGPVVNTPSEAMIVRTYVVSPDQVTSDVEHFTSPIVPSMENMSVKGSELVMKYDRAG